VHVHGVCDSDEEEVELRTFVASMAFSSEGMDLWRGGGGALGFFCVALMMGGSSHVVYTVISSLMARSRFCRSAKSVAMADRWAANQLSCARLLTTQMNRTWRVTAPSWRAKRDRVLEFDVVVSRQLWRMSRRRGRVNVAPVLPARRTTLSNWRRARIQP